MHNWQLKKIYHEIKIMTFLIRRCKSLVYLKHGREPAICNDSFIQTKKWKFRILSHWLSFHDIYYKLYVKFWQER